MVPEITYYVPAEKLGDFKWRVSGLSAARLIRTRKTKEDNSPVQNENPEVEDLVEKMRGAISRLPKETLFGNLNHFGRQRWNLQTPPEWSNLVASLSPSNLNRITRAFRTLTRIGFKERSLEELSQMDWNRFQNYEIPGLGQRGKNLVRSTFEGLTFTDRGNPTHGTGI